MICDGDSLLDGLMMINMNGPDLEGVDEEKTLILESVKTCKNDQKRVS